MAHIRPTRLAKPGTLPEDVDFRHLRPKGLETAWTYVKSGASAYGPSGVDVFLGEAAVVDPIIKSGLMRVDHEEETGGGHEEHQHENQGETDSPVQDDCDSSEVEDVIDTSVLLSQGIVQAALFGSPTPSEVDLSQGAVRRAFDISQDGLHSEPSAQDVKEDATQLQRAENPDSDTPIANRLRLRRDFKCDVNFVGVNEYLSSLVQGGDLDGDDTISDADAIELDETFLGSLSIGVDGQLSKSAKEKRTETLRTMRWAQSSSNFEFGDEYPGLGGDEARPVAELRSLCHSPVKTFFYFAPKSMWVSICDETNRYCSQQIRPRAERMRAKQPDQRGTTKETLTQIRRRFRMKPAYETQELLDVMGLLVAHMLCSPRGDFLSTEDGAVLAGTFGKFMPRNRCQDILRDLHFVDDDSEPTRDKLRRLRPVVDKLQERFLVGWTLPYVFSFDEGVLPATSKCSTTRMFMPDKPHRFEIYVGKVQARENEVDAFDHKTGAAAVVRNLKVVLVHGRQKFHAVAVIVSILLSSSRSSCYL
ncbi:hypothetical protein PHMEG_0007943 [Phytophthora megakarya]|uniref:PiggyBac transposable element-derived protein domain-containing protein n=1 Tax=Phytophthora megakarya TaxID=4795 RepID=A0A225WLA7_9STRA|nr:hypothetical protein PHMEG_0007943 [Phytophthora megakarya]